jgi:hypothetical protein
LPQSEAAVYAKQLYPQLSKLCRPAGIGGNLRNLGNTDPLFWARIALISSVWFGVGGSEWSVGCFPCASQITNSLGAERETSAGCREATGKQGRGS